MGALGPEQRKEPRYQLPYCMYLASGRRLSYTSSIEKTFVKLEIHESFLPHRKHCRTATGECSQSWKCCYEVDQISLVKFACADSDNFLQGSVIVMCKCQVCDKLHAQIRGQVLSSLDRNPVVLATIMIGSEIAAFTDQGGRVFFDLFGTRCDLLN